MTFKEWLETQPEELRGKLQVAFDFGRIDGLATAQGIVERNLTNG